MKTTKIFSVLSLVLIFATVNTVYSKGRTTDNRMQAEKKTIRHEVTIHHSLGFTLCYNYLVKITDANGRLVAPPQVFVPGISKYVFTENVSNSSNVRIASLSLPENVDPYFCATNLNAKSDPMTGPFISGKTYSFDLYPIIEKGVVVEN